MISRFDCNGNLPIFGKKNGTNAFGVWSVSNVKNMDEKMARITAVYRMGVATMKIVKTEILFGSEIVVTGVIASMFCRTIKPATCCVWTILTFVLNDGICI